MTLLRFVVDVECEGDVTSSEGDAMLEKMQKYGDSVVGVQHLGNKQGDDGAGWWHAHHSDRRTSCQDCAEHSQDQRH